MMPSLAFQVEKRDTAPFTRLLSHNQASDTEFRRPYAVVVAEGPWPLHTIMAFSRQEHFQFQFVALLLSAKVLKTGIWAFWSGQARGGTGATSQNPNGLFNGRRGPSEACAPEVDGWIVSTELLLLLHLHFWAANWVKGTTAQANRKRNRHFQRKGCPAVLSSHSGRRKLVSCPVTLLLKPSTQKKRFRFYIATYARGLWPTGVS